MKLMLPAIAATAAFVTPMIAEARPITIETALKNYGGNNAYLALYVTDASGAYKGTLWMAGGSARYYRHLSDWQRASGGSLSEIDGVTGASVGSGRTLKISVDLADAMIDAGYQVHVDAAVEGGSDNASRVAAPLTSAASGKPVAGRGYVKSLTVTF